jgi:hypothetical protein
MNGKKKIINNNMNSKEILNTITSFSVVNKTYLDVETDIHKKMSEENEKEKKLLYRIKKFIKEKIFRIKKKYPELKLEIIKKEVSLDNNNINNFDEMYKTFKKRVIELVDSKVYDYNFKDVMEITDETSIRRFISKIYNSGNLIAIKGRMGPAQYIIMHQRLRDRLLKYLDGDGKYLGGIYIIIDNTLEDIVIIGRQVNETQDKGIKIVINQDSDRWNLAEVGNELENQFETLKYKL